MAEQAHSAAAAGIFALLLTVHLALKFYARLSGKLRPQEVELMKEIKQLHRSANEMSNPSTFAKAAKLKRTAAAKEKELAELRQKFSLKKAWWLPPSKAFPKVLMVAVYLLLAQWFWHTTVATVPVALLKPSGDVGNQTSVSGPDCNEHWQIYSGKREYLLYTGKKDASGDRVEVGIIPWLVLTSRVSAYVAHKIAGHGPPKSNSRSPLRAKIKFT